MFEHLREDLRRYGTGRRERIHAMVFAPGVWAIAGYRFSRWVYTAQLPRQVRKLLNIVVTFSGTAVKVLTNVELPAQAVIGPGLLIAHTGYIVLASDVVLGSHCTLTQGVTIGHGGGGKDASFACPVIGDRVYIGPGAAIIGGITVGDDALIGIGAIVTKSVPERGVVVGNPARVVSHQGSFDMIAYPGIENDLRRRAALEERDRAGRSEGVVRQLK
ncbi:MAG: serine acetyltransferase [Acidobacteriota bacterium]|nr:serine acetyltransferase [Acidobacteriota bacterium]